MNEKDKDTVTKLILFSALLGIVEILILMNSHIETHYLR